MFSIITFIGSIGLVVYGCMTIKQANIVDDVGRPLLCIIVGIILCIFTGLTIPLENGTRPVAKFKHGDVIVDQSGARAVVVGVWCVIGEESCGYKVRFSSGEVYITKEWENGFWRIQQ